MHTRSNNVKKHSRVTVVQNLNMVIVLLTLISHPYVRWGQLMSASGFTVLHKVALPHNSKVNYLALSSTFNLVDVG